MEEKQIHNIGGGLIPFIPDGTEFHFGGVFGTEDVSDIPDFETGQSEILDQKNTDLCTGFATCAASAIEEKETLDPYWSFAVSKMLSGNKDEWGQDLKVAMAVHCKKENEKRGAIRYKNIQEKDIKALRDIANWPKDYFYEAKKYQKKSYFFIDAFGYKDLFDAFVGSLWKFREKGQAIVTGELWRQGWSYAQNGIIPTSYMDTGTGHAFIFTGKTTIDNAPYLIAQLSNGTEIGDKGRFYFPREVVNKESIFGNFMFIDMEKEDAKERDLWFKTNMWGKGKIIMKKFFFL